MNSDLTELLCLLNEAKVRYLVIGGQAAIAYSEPRYTKDLDLWVEPSKLNAQKLIKSLEKFGAPTNSISTEDFEKPGTVFIFGIEPNRVDILTKVKGATFTKCYKSRTIHLISRLKIPFVSISDLIKIKKATGRPQDLMDVEKLERTLRISAKK
jgi:hypothetical protein